MNLQDLRRRVCGLPDENGATGPTWIDPKEAIYLLDTIDSMQSRLESLEKDAARYRWLRERDVESGVCILDVGEWVMPASCIALNFHSSEAVDCAIDTAMQANKVE